MDAYSWRQRFCLRDNTKRDSFDERICDDLSEVILQYLPIEVKFRFESVSKQFQRTVFQKQYDLQIKDSKYLESILKKCPKINSLNFRLKPNEDSEQIVDLIIKYCNNLFEINGYLDINENTIQRLVQKLNKKCFTLKSVETSDEKRFKAFQLFSDFKELHISYSSKLKYALAQDNFLKIVDGASRVQFKHGHVKTLVIDFQLNLLNSSLNLLKTLIENNPQIKRLHCSLKCKK